MIMMKIKLMMMKIKLLMMKIKLMMMFDEDEGGEAEDEINMDEDKHC